MSKGSTNLFYFKAKGGFPVWETKAPVELLLANEGKTFWCEIGRETGVRSLNQNSALHVGFELIAKALNDSGWDMRKLMKQDVDIPWNGVICKEYLWRPIQKAMLGTASTTKLSKIDPSEVWDVLMRHLSEKCGIEYIEYPNKNAKRL